MYQKLLNMKVDGWKLFVFMLLYLLSISPVKAFEKTQLSGDITITLDDGLWKKNNQKTLYKDIKIDLVCQKSVCEPEIWAKAPEFNQADHYGIIETNTLEEGWKLEINLKINPDPWLTTTGEAQYKIEIIPDGNNFIGKYTGTFNNLPVSGKAEIEINPHWGKAIPNHQPIIPQEHPRLIFRKHQLPQLRAKANTDYGKAIINRLKTVLSHPIYYTGYGPNGGYHAAGHCFLYLLDEDEKAARKAWDIVQTTIDREPERLLEKSLVVAGIAMAYDMCYDAWEDEQRIIITNWLADRAKLLIEGRKGNGWNPTPWSNWSAKARSAAGLAALAILENNSINDIDIDKLIKIAEINIKGYLTKGTGDRGFGTEGDLYHRESIYAIMPFLQAYKNVLGKDLVSGSNAQWILPHYLMRLVGDNGEISLPTYGRHRIGPDGGLFALGLGILPNPFKTAAFWFFQRQFDFLGDRTFGIGKYSPHEAIYILASYPDEIIPQNPEEILEKVLVDQQKGFYVFRERWLDETDFVASIYLKREPLRKSWSFPEAGSFRIWGLGGRWAVAGPSNNQRISENVLLTDTIGREKTEPIYFEKNPDGSGVVSLKGKNWIRSFAVDYSRRSGTLGLFAVVDKFTGETEDKALPWIMHTEGEVKIDEQSFLITAENGATMKGTFITPSKVNISYQEGKIVATGGKEFFVIMTVQYNNPPKIEIFGNGIEAQVKVGSQIIFYKEDHLNLIK